LGGGDEVDPPIEYFDRPLRYREVCKAANQECKRDRDPRDTSLVCTGQYFGCLSSLSHTKERP
jgi:hypothetical protein